MTTLDMDARMAEELDAAGFTGTAKWLRTQRPEDVEPERIFLLQMLAEAESGRDQLPDDEYVDSLADVRRSPGGPRWDDGFEPRMGIRGHRWSKCGKRWGQRCLWRRQPDPVWHPCPRTRTFTENAWRSAIACPQRQHPRGFHRVPAPCQRGRRGAK